MKRRKAPDYLGSKFASLILAKNIEKYYRLRGYAGVRAWVEVVDLSETDRIFVVRSNLRFKVS